MPVFKVESNPTFRDIQGRFARAEKSLLDESRKQMRTLGKAHVQAIQRFAPKKTGAFAAGIRFRSFQSGDSVGFTVSTPQPLGKWLRPPGTKAHVIRAKNANMLRFVARGGNVVFAKSVNHPGYRPSSDFVKDGIDSLESERRVTLRRISLRYIEQVTK